MLFEQETGDAICTVVEGSDTTADAMKTAAGYIIKIKKSEAF